MLCVDNVAIFTDIYGQVCTIHTYSRCSKVFLARGAVSELGRRSLKQGSGEKCLKVAAPNKLQQFPKSTFHIAWVTCTFYMLSTHIHFISSYSYICMY